MSNAGSETLLQSTPLGCDSSQLPDPRTLLLALPSTNAPRLSAGRRYRFCLVLLEGGGSHDDLALVVSTQHTTSSSVHAFSFFFFFFKLNFLFFFLKPCCYVLTLPNICVLVQVGCSDVLPLVKTSSLVATAADAKPPMPPAAVRISGLSANLTSTGALAVWVQLSPSSARTPTSPCRLAVTVFAAGSLVAREGLNCSLPGTVISGLGPGTLQVCATAASATDSTPTTRPAASATRCTSVVGPGLRGRDVRSMSASVSGAASAGLLAALTGAALLGGAGAALVLTLWLAARWRRRGGGGGGRGRIGLDHDTGMLYRPPSPPPEHEQHARYVKLQATTKL